MKLQHILSGAIGATLCLFAGATAATAETWRVQSLFPPDNINHKAMQRAADRIEKMSDGRLSLTIIPVKQVVGPTGTLEAVRSGIIDGHFTWPGLWAGTEPGFAPIADLPGGFPSAYEHLECLYQDGALDVMRELYAAQGLHTVGAFAVGVESLPSRVPLRTIADLEGRKMRMPGGITSMVAQKFGVAPVKLPFSEAFSALEKGVVDASDNSSLAENLRMGFHDHADFAIYPGIHSSPSLDFSVNAAKWEALPDDLKAIVELAMYSAAVDSVYERDSNDRAAEKQVLAEGKVELIDWSDADRRAFRNGAKEVWLDYAKKSPLAAKAIDTQINCLEEYGLL